MYPAYGWVRVGLQRIPTREPEMGSAFDTFDTIGFLLTAIALLTVAL